MTRWRRSLVTVGATALLSLTLASTASAGYGQLWSTSLASSPAGARLAVRGDHVFAVWPQVDSADKGASHAVVSLVAQSFDRSDGSPSPDTPSNLVSLPVDDTLGTFAVACDSAGGLVVAWTDSTAGTTWMQRFSPSLQATYDPVVLCVDADLTAMGGAQAATPEEIVPDAVGGCYVRLRLTPTPADGDTLLNHVDPAGSLSVAAPGTHPTNGSVGALAVDSSNRACALLVPPGRTGARLDRYDTTLQALASTVSLYGSETPAETPAPSAVGAFTDADGVVFAGSLGGGYIFPRFLPAFDAVMTLGKLLELLAPQARPLSEQIAEIPSSTLVHKTVACPWALKGTVMRTATEQLQREEALGAAEVSLIDGIQVHKDGGWVQLLPDADEPVFHVYAEGLDHAASERFAEDFLDVVRDVIREHTE